MASALVTGSTGQDGFYLSELLRSKGYTVHGFEGELTNARAVREAVATAQPDECYHLAAQTFVAGEESETMRVNVDGTGLTQLTNTPGYDAEATVAKDGRIVFTSVRDGDMEIYSMNADGSDVKRLTNLARIELSEEEARATLAQLSEIFGLIQKMQAVDASEIKPMSHAQDVVQRLRPDLVTEKDQRELYQSVAPQVEAGLYLVPRVIE